MKTSRYVLVAVALMLVAPSSSVHATDSVAQLNLEGNPSCNALASNSVLQVRDNNPPAPGVIKALVGPDGQQFEYAIGTEMAPGDTLAFWEVKAPGAGTAGVKPVNFVILKSVDKGQKASEHEQGARVFHFGNNGVVRDETAIARGTITSVSICYGLAGQASASLPPCDPATLGAVCKADPTRIVTIFDESTPNWRIETCSCGSVFTECNPELQAGNAGACTNATGALQFVPVEVQLGRDPDSYYCTIIAGKRKCYRK